MYSFINFRNIPGNARNFTVNEVSLFSTSRSHLKCVPQNYKNVSLGKLRYMIFASKLLIARTVKEAASKLSLLQSCVRVMTCTINYQIKNACKVSC